MKRIGPDLKMPNLKAGEMKVPPFLKDLYADLRDRRLLPLVALILIAIVATPILLGGGSEKPEPAPAPAPVGGAEASSAQSLTVVKSEPGLRNYRQRLSHRSPTNPFKQRFDGPRLAGGGLNEPTTVPTPPTEVSGGGGSKGGESEPAGTPASGGSGGGAPAGGESGNHSDDTELPGGTTIYTLEVTLQITRIESKPDGSVEKKGPTLYKDVQAPAALPGEKTPVITYLGMGSKSRAPMFLVSNEVTGIFGEAECISGAKTCQLLALEEGFPVTFVYGENDVRYKINLIKSEPIVIGHT